MTIGQKQENQLSPIQQYARLFELAKEGCNTELVSLVTDMINASRADERNLCAAVAEADSHYYGGRIAKKIRNRK